MQAARDTLVGEGSAVEPGVGEGKQGELEEEDEGEVEVDLIHHM
jgi:hypothetical protein